MPESEARSEIKLVLEMTARVDERVKLIIERQSDMSVRLNNFMDSNNVLSNRVSVIEAKGSNGIGELKNKYDTIIERLVRLESSPLIGEIDFIKNHIESSKEEMNNFENRMSKVEDSNTSIWTRINWTFDVITKISMPILITWLLWQLGFQNHHP